MKIAGAAKILLALFCSCQQLYQIGDRFGDTFAALATDISVSRQASPIAISLPGDNDNDDWLALTLGRTLLPAPVRLDTPEQRIGAASAPSPAGLSRDILAAEKSRSPPGSDPPLLAEPSHRVFILAASAVFSLAPPAA